MVIKNDAGVRALILGSSSVYRRQLLERLGLAFRCVAPQVVETPFAGERPSDTASRLAVAKALAVEQREPRALIIASDQVAELDGEPLGKPGDHAGATRQLRAMSGRAVAFHTAVCLLDAATGRLQLQTVPTVVHFRALDAGRIENYLCREQPYDCAGSAKVESLGIALVQKIESDDPTALIGLPLIALTSMLAQENVFVV
jgi:septum formation protein